MQLALLNVYTANVEFMDHYGFCTYFICSSPTDHNDNNYLISWVSRPAFISLHHVAIRKHMWPNLRYQIARTPGSIRKFKFMTRPTFAKCPEYSNNAKRNISAP